MDESAQKRAGGQHHGTGAELPAVGKTHARDAALDQQVIHFALDDGQIGRLLDRGLHGGGVKLAIRLGARSPHGGALAAVEQAKLDAGRIGGAAHQAIERIDFADEMAFAQTADRRIAGHRSDGGETLGD
jgi:hypothetical protein